MRTICLFCGKNHKKPKPVLCATKGEIMNAYLKEVGTKDAYKVFLGIDRGLIDLDGQAQRLIASRKEQRVKRK